MEQQIERLSVLPDQIERPSWRDPLMMKKAEKIIKKLKGKEKGTLTISMQERAMLERRNYSEVNLELENLAKEFENMAHLKVPEQTSEPLYGEDVLHGLESFGLEIKNDSSDDERNSSPLRRKVSTEALAEQPKQIQKQLLSRISDVLAKQKPILVDVGTNTLLEVDDIKALRQSAFKRNHL